MTKKLFYAKIEGIARQAIWHEGQYHDVFMGALLKEEYFLHKNKGDYSIPSLIKRWKMLMRKTNE